MIVGLLHSSAIMFPLCGGGLDKVIIGVTGTQAVAQEGLASGSSTRGLHFLKKLWISIGNLGLVCKSYFNVISLCSNYDHSSLAQSTCMDNIHPLSLRFFIQIIIMSNQKLTPRSQYILIILTFYFPFLHIQS